MTANFINIDSIKFSLNGIEHHKVFVPVKVSDTHLKIVGVYDIRFVLMGPVKFSDVTIGGATFTDINSLIASLNDVIYSRVVLQSVSESLGYTPLDKSTYAGTAADLDLAIKAKVEDQIIDGVTDKAPAQNVVFDEFKKYLKRDGSSPMTGALSLIGITNPTAPTITNVGTAGTTTYDYYIVAEDINGGQTLVSPVGSTTTGNATLDATNYNTVSWTAISGAVKYYVLKTNTGTLLGTATGTSLDDTGQATSAFTAPTRNNTADVKADGKLFSNGLELADTRFSNLASDLSATEKTDIRGKIDAETPSGAQTKADAKVEDQIVDGVIDKAPSQNKVFDALVLKANDSEVAKTVTANGTTYSPDVNGDVDLGTITTETYREDSRTATEGQTLYAFDSTTKITDATKVHEVFVQRDRLVEDEWRINSASEIELLISPSAGNSVVFVGSTLQAEDTTSIKKTSNIESVWTGTQADYDAITTKDTTTLYFIQ